MTESFRHAVITGASSGIGRAVAMAYAAPLMRLTLIGRDSRRLEEAAAACKAKGAEVETAALDVRDRAAMRDFLVALDRRAPVDLLIANAGISTGLPAGALTEDPDAVRGIVAINLLGALNTVEPLIAPMCARGRGRIALTGSISALRGLPHCPAYCATKAAVHLYAESLRGQLARHGVGVSLIVPGFVHTPLNADLVSPKPLAMDDSKAARIIRRGLDRGKATIAFPRLLYWGARLLTVLPVRLVDFFMVRQHVDVPVTKERELA
ncbi:MAG: SDR family NAD(P)-dependent oxidoreductase [Hyphomicrobiales bacterium]|nr:SDR family NAD(P)-dependent oxidoreductase [Hyphomicrobiales bacterium]